MTPEIASRGWDPSVDLHIDYANELNAQQLAAVTAPPGPALVIAGAGSGKTRTLVYRVGFLLENGIPPERILLLTFTNRSAGEMMRRVAELLGRELDALWGGTFHSIGNRILRAHADLLGYGRHFGILDRDDSRELIKASAKEAGIETDGGEIPKETVLAEIFSLAANTLRTPTEVLLEDFDYLLTPPEQIEKIHAAYTARKVSENDMDFDDLLTLWLRLFKEQAAVLETFQRRFQFILVDEYQDTNPLQGDLIDLLAARHHNLMVVGDDAQSIYAWRGADFKNILNFPERYPEARTFKIETNYRSRPEILEVANAAIAANENQFKKTLVPARGSGAKPCLVTCLNAREQAGVLARRVLQLHEAGVSLGKMAVLYRSHFHAVELQLELAHAQIPFEITSGIRFFEQAHVKDVVAHLKLVDNPRDELAFMRAVKLLPGIGAKGAEKLWIRFKAELQGTDARSGTAASPLATALQRAGAVAPKKSQLAWTQLAVTMSQIEDEAVRGEPAKMIDLLIEAGYGDHLKANYANYDDRMDDVHKLMDYVRSKGTLEDFLSEMALATNADSETGEPATERDRDSLHLSTIHQAKGLEFDVVFIIMLCENMFPTARSARDPDAIEEERRLFYVAITRARDELYLMRPLIRNLDGDNKAQGASRFLNEIPLNLLEEHNFVHVRPYGV